MAKVDVYTKLWCPYSGRAISMLNRRGISYNEINITTDLNRAKEMKKRSGRSSVPQIFVGNVHVGGSDDLFIADKSGLLEKLLAVETTVS